MKNVLQKVVYKYEVKSLPTNKMESESSSNFYNDPVNTMDIIAQLIPPKTQLAQLVLTLSFMIENIN